MAKKRLDLLLLEKMPQYSRQQLQSWIMQRKAYVDGIIVDKAGALCAPEAVIELVGVEEPRYVGRAGFKLEHALKTSGIVVQDKVVMDAGLSTGGFTDCLLQQGAKKVYGVDVGYGQVHEKIRRDPRVVVMEKTNLRQVRDLGELVDVVTLDLSFISLLKVMEAVNAVLKPGGSLITLIKPQFEAERHQIGRGGIVKDAAVHKQVLERITKGIEAQGFTLQGTTESPITGTDGNKEFLAWFVKVN